METYVVVNQVSTRVSTLGKEVGQSFKDSEDLVVIIPGNPGIISFYDQFAKKIHEKLQCSVWCVGHAGHNQGKNQIKSIPKFDKYKDLYGLEGQVQHKVDFFEKYVPKNARVHLIGHSIGSYMIVEMLDRPNIAKTVNKSYLLFPTVEYMAQTPNGKILTNYVKYVVWLLVFLSRMFTFLPTIVQNALINIYIYITGIPKYHLDNIKQVVKPGVLKRVFFLAYEEMDQVLQRNDRSIRDNLNKIKMFYGEHDGWTPISYYEKIKKDFPGIDVELSHLNHAFVLNASSAVGDIVCDWITNKS